MKTSSNGVVSDSLPSAAELAPNPNSVENSHSKGRALITHLNFIGVSLHDRLHHVLKMLDTEIHMVTSYDGV